MKFILIYLAFTAFIYGWLEMFILDMIKWNSSILDIAGYSLSTAYSSLPTTYNAPCSVFMYMNLEASISTSLEKHLL